MMMTLINILQALFIALSCVMVLLFALIVLLDWRILLWVAGALIVAAILVVGIVALTVWKAEQEPDPTPPQQPVWRVR